MVKAPLSHITGLLFFCTLLLFSSQTLCAQSFGVKLYNVNNGLPGTECYKTYRDNNGYLWIGTSSGISRFDGRQFTNYSTTDGLPSLTVSAIFQDSKNRLWIGTNAGMAQFVNNKFNCYPTSDGLLAFYVNDFIETSHHDVWALTDNGIYQFENNAWKKIILYPGLENHVCRNVVESNGDLYINYDSIIVCKTKSGELLQLSAAQAKVPFFLSLVRNDNTIFAIAYSQIFEIRNYNFVPLYKRLKKRSACFLIDSKNSLWLAEDSCIKISLPNDWQHFYDSIPNRYGFVFSMNEDADNNTWLCTREGLVKIKNIAFASVNQIPNLFTGTYNIVPLPHNELIFSPNSNRGFFLWSNNKSKPISPPSLHEKYNYYGDIIDGYAFDDNKAIWIVTRFRKLFYFDGKSLHDFTHSLHLSTTENIYDIHFSKRRKQLFICADSTLLYGSDTSFATFIPHNTGVPITKPTRVYELKNGLLLLYIDRQGVFCIDSANNLISLQKEIAIDGNRQGILSDVCFYEDKQADFWIAVPGFGIYQYRFTKDIIPVLQNHFTISNGLQSNKIFSLVSDNQNRLWIACSTGIDILQQNKNSTWEVFNYARAEDLLLTKFEFTKLIADESGAIWLSSPNKVIKLNVAAVQLHKQSPHILIEKISLLFKETDWSKLSDSTYNYYQLPYHPVLLYNQNSFGISFNAVDVSSTNSSPDYSYQLLPVNTGWSIPSKTKSVSFAQLPAGEYQFMVRAKEGASGWSKPAVFQFTIMPPFWNRWWFRLIVIALAAYIVVSIFMARVKKIRHDAFINNQLKELEMKALKAQMNPHFIFNALNSIQALIASDKKNESIHYIGFFSRLLRQVLEHSDSNVISLDKELETTELYIQLEALRMGVQLNYQQVIPEHVVAEFEKIPPLILQPFVENSLWHGLNKKEGQKQIIIRAETKENWLVCEIEDNGIGRKKAEEWKSKSALLYRSKGIDITVKRLIDFNNDATVVPVQFFDLRDDNNNPSGTRVCVYIKRKRG